MDDLIDLIYETIADPAVWNTVARRMSGQLGAQSFWMFYMDAAGPDFLALCGLSPTLLEAYEAHFHSRDILMEEELRRPQDFLGRAVREQDIVGEAVWQASEIYNDLARPNGMHHVLSMNLSSAQTQPVPFLTFFRPPGTAMFDDAAVASCEGIIPHLRRAIRLNRLISVERRTIPAWTATVLDQIPAGIFLLDGRGAVLHANRSAQAMASRRDGLAIKAGRLISTGGRSGARLERAIAACVSAGRRGSRDRHDRREPLPRLGLGVRCGSDIGRHGSQARGPLRPHRRRAARGRRPGAMPFPRRDRGATRRFDQYCPDPGEEHLRQTRGWAADGDYAPAGGGLGAAAWEMTQPGLKTTRSSPEMVMRKLSDHLSSRPWRGAAQIGGQTCSQEARSRISATF
jgi:PAS domain-containing protein